MIDYVLHFGFLIYKIKDSIRKLDLILLQKRSKL